MLEVKTLLMAYDFILSRFINNRFLHERKYRVGPGDKNSLEVTHHYLVVNWFDRTMDTLRFLY